MIRDGHRPEALAALQEWLASQTGCGHLFVLEPYFGPESVDLLKLVADSEATWEVSIVAGQDSLDRVTQPYETAYKAAWRERSGDEPPSTRIEFIGGRTTKKFPIHDRWWLTERSGLHLGTSYNGFGSKLSTVRVMSLEETARVHEELEPYFTGRRRVFGDERLDYFGFSL
jgi:hypothetical protein